MKIAIIGYGKMGQAVELAASTAGHEIVAKIDPFFVKATKDKPKNVATEISKETLNGAEVAIDFTHPDVVLENIRKLAEAKVQIVVGTTGWYDSLPEVEEIVKVARVGLIYAGNFSVGVNTFYAIVEKAAQLLTGKDFDVALREIHHTGKADAPSGTAREIAQKVLANFPEKKEIILDNAEQPVPADKLQISSARIGKVVGVHEVAFDGGSDAITLTHIGKNRDGYAAGSVSAGEWLVKKGEAEVFTANDWLGF
ncbi:4-hydroxy-tetrahydrodipicolinate reductase [Candidatus Gracilibacteria bacterium]|nr:4-hydroxy-tetrahydrodipicolinate reductase [Candidatus Gracilibacteria bacterium]MCF7856169.1 4-hydroxy-tetrahydrodipicolinate reductase [Candidatus Gracilibacteria bacterium]MCF7896635.1 4-hydroxy-tetrahydrodipicolinate reductase [Candidatus Gracilibacteria bacterium]